MVWAQAIAAWMPTTPLPNGVLGTTAVPYI